MGDGEWGMGERVWGTRGERGKGKFGWTGLHWTGVDSIEFN